MESIMEISQFLKYYWDNIRDKLRSSSRVKEVKHTYSSAAGSTTNLFLFYDG
jgi:hypothetical protein